jgi:nitric oxide dioxygenase
MLTSAQTEIVKATVPVLQAHGEAITATFYRNLFAAHPELYNIFNPANQHNGGQQRSLAAAVLAYAQHIENPFVLGQMLERIESKHVSLEVLPEHYPIVGKFLLGAIKETLGAAATPDILDAWAVAYGQLANLMIGHEKSRYDSGAAQPGGWRGFKPFRVQNRVPESSVMTSFNLVPADGSPLPPFKPGQYLSVKVHPPAFAYDQIRQYSLSCAPNGKSYRISVQREVAAPGDIDAPHGLVSNYLHDHINEGDILNVHLPSGDFVLRGGDAPVVLLSGGSGITALLSMLEHLAVTNDSRDVLFIHAARERSRHPFNDHIRSLARKQGRVKVVTLYEEINDADRHGEHYDEIGRISTELLRAHMPSDEAQFYYCGPIGFMGAVERTLDELDVPSTHRFSETFAPDPSFTIA